MYTTVGNLTLIHTVMKINVAEFTANQSPSI